MEERRLHKCGVCGEWFNTTTPIMIQHYRLKHFDTHWKNATRIVISAVDNMSAAFKGAATALNYFNTSADKTGLVNIAAPSACGKTDAFASFTRNCLLATYKSTFGIRRFFLLDWWKLKLSK